jgi:hypothetical protein
MKQQHPDKRERAVSPQTIYAWIRQDSQREHWESLLRRRGKRAIRRDRVVVLDPSESCHPSRTQHKHAEFRRVCLHDPGRCQGARWPFVATCFLRWARTDSRLGSWTDDRPRCGASGRSRRHCLTCGSIGNS